ncbi:ComEC/Rec2 family competence protein [Flavobacteriaceae bacterium MHTCC 0001]
MRLLNFTIIKLTLFFIVGIIIGYYLYVEVYVSLVVTTIALIALGIAYVTQKKQLETTVWFGVLAFFAMVSIGVLTVNLHNQKQFSNHYSDYISKDSDEHYTISFRVREVLKSGNYYDKYVIDILEVNDKSVIGKSLLNVKKDSSFKPLNIDETFLVKTEFKNLIHPLNPGQFNYKTYLEKQYIYHQFFIRNDAIFHLNLHKATIFGLANRIRTHINRKLKRYNFAPDELAIINALLLGQRQNINEDIYKSYTNAGAIHILAVSGLHIGIILYILSLLLKPIEKLRHGKLLKACILIVILWGFAIIAGLSASVTRAVTMFSIITLGIHLNRPTNIFNTLSISILVLLLFKPMFLFDVGFQLSYLAVFAIVILDPLFYRLWQPKYWLLDKYWHTITVTFAAQFGIIPISLFYFHQFPGLFFLSNLVIIPVLGFILGFGIIVILLAVLNALPQIVATAFETVIGLMNRFVTWVSQQERFLFTEISFNLAYAIAFYLLIIMFFRLIFRKNYPNLRLFLCAVIAVQCVFLYTTYVKPEHQFIIFHKSRYSLFGNVNKNTIEVANNFEETTTIASDIIGDYKVKHHLNSITDVALKDVYFFGDKTLLVVDSLGVYNIKTLQPDYVLLRQSPKINLSRLIDSIQPKQIIADGSNYKSYIEHWEAICRNKKLPFHQTSKKGAFIIDY